MNTNNIAAENIPCLNIEANDDGTITLEQNWCGNAERVAIHPVHVRLLAEKLGMVGEVSATDAELLRTERGQVAALRLENDRLKRNMLRVREHGLALQADFAEHADWKHADLVEPMNQINTLVLLFDMAVDDYTARDPCESPRATHGNPAEIAADGDVTPSHARTRRNSTPADDAPPQQVRSATNAPLNAAPLQLDLEGGNVR